MENYKQFEEKLIKALGEKYPDAKIVKKPRYKFNTIKKGLVIEMPGCVQPTVYPEDLYETYQKLEDIEFIIASIDASMEIDKMVTYKEKVKDWEKVQEHIYPYIVNAEKNRLCMDCNNYVYEKRLDFLCGVFIGFVDDEGQACVNITEDLLDLWNISKEEIFEIAEKNVKYDVKPMRKVIAELMNTEYSEEDIEDEAMYVVTNKMKYRGAAAMFDFELLRKTAETLESNFFIIPSSIHEIILVLEADVSSKQTLRDIVQEVNQTQTSVDDYLSDNIYYYNREEDQVKIVEVD